MSNSVRQQIPMCPIAQSVQTDTKAGTVQLQRFERVKNIYPSPYNNKLWDLFWLRLPRIDCLANRRPNFPATSCQRAGLDCDPEVGHSLCLGGEKHAGRGGFMAQKWKSTHCVRLRPGWKRGERQKNSVLGMRVGQKRGKNEWGARAERAARAFCI